MKYIRKLFKLIYDNKRSIPVYLLSLYCFFVFTVYLRQEQITGAALFTALGFVFISTVLMILCLLPLNLFENRLKRYAIWVNAFFLLLSPIGSFIMVEIMVGNVNPDMFKNYGIYNLIWYIVVFYMIFIVIMDARLSIRIGSALIYTMSMINYLVFRFRGNPIIPSDILVWRTAMSVADNYQLHFTRDFLSATLILLVFQTVSFLLARREKKPQFKIRLIAAGSFLLCLILVFYWFFDTDLVKSKIRVIDYFAPKYTYCSYGTAFGFVANIEAMDVDKPEGYSIDRVRELLASAENESAEPVLTTAQKPDIIVIMNEAFSDLSMIEDYKTNMDYLPYIRSLREDTVKGVLYTSVFGGATSDTEYEFLTGNSMAVMPPNSVPYQQFVTEPTDSLAVSLRAQGYYNIAIHPYKPTGYKRDLVYPLLGFDEFLSEVDFTNPETIRGFISDRASYAKIIEKYELYRDKGPLFFFNVTMQNHGGYSSEQIFPDEDMVRLVDYPGFAYIDQYLSLLRKSDMAFEELTAYFKEQDRPVIILLFGDHQPVAYSSLYDIMVPEKKSEHLKYKVPFLIWANYDIEEADVRAMSVNYLSSYLLKFAGLKTTTYNNYLLQLYKELPVINSLFYINKNYVLYSLAANTPYKGIINDYKYIGYNNALDKRNKLDKYYYIEQETSDMNREEQLIK